MNRLRAFLVVLLALAACGRKAKSPAEPEAPRPTHNHALHLSRDLVCADCHDPDEAGTPVMPAAETCFECHEDLATESEAVRAYFDEVRQADGSYRFPRASHWYDLVVNHKSHGKYEVGCADCHGEPIEKAYPRAAPLDLKKTCMTCHSQRGASNECATCHTETNPSKRPPDHDRAFKNNHGHAAPRLWRRGRGESCAICHEVPQSCDACHKAVTPKSHRPRAFKNTHGTDLDSWDSPWDQVSCSLCHERQGCVRCHQVEKPKSHTRPFERRLHGVAAEIERASCLVCHKQDFCVNCHEQQEPISHRGQWGRGQQSHCVACHEPLTATGCFTCHKQTLGHLQATPLPADQVHNTSTDPTGCEQCHPVVPHFDSGGRCRSCHR